MNGSDNTPIPVEDNAMPDENERTFGMLVHLLGIFTGFLGPLVIWLIKKDEMPFVDDQGKEALNLQITALFVFMALFILLIMLSWLNSTFGLILGILLMLLWVAFGISVLVFQIMATVAANKGQYYRHPVCLRLLK